MAQSTWKLLGCSLAIAVLLVGCPPQEPEPDQGPEASFTAAPRTGPAPLTVGFTSTSSAGDSSIRIWAWNFGDGGTSPSPNPTHTYFTPGVYDVSLTVTTALGSDTLRIEDYIVVTETAGAGMLGAEGGTFSAAGVNLTISADILDQDTFFTINSNETEFSVGPSEPIEIVSAIYQVAHDNATNKFYQFTNTGGIDAARIDVPFFTDAVPSAGRTAGRTHLLLNLPDGQLAPVIGRVSSGRVLASLPQLPSGTKFAVVYRPGASVHTVAAPAAKAASFNWPDAWRVVSSEQTLQQLTALRVGKIDDTAPYQRRSFTAAELAVTETTVLADLQELHGVLEDGGFRAPALIMEEGVPTLFLFNINATYNSNYTDFSALMFEQHAYGSISIDPRQLLSVTLHNATLFNGTPAQVDLEEEFNFKNAVAQAVSHAVFAGYALPRIGDGDGALAGVDDAVAVWLGQWMDDFRIARSFGAGDFSDLAQPLFAATDDVPGYSAAGHEFLTYVQNAYKPVAPLAFLAESGADPGLLEGLRIGLDALPDDGAGLTGSQARQKIYEALDAAMEEHVGVSLPEAYEDFGRDRAIENGESALLRPSDAARDGFQLNDDRISPENLLERLLQAPTDEVDVLSGNTGALRSVPPMSSRVVFFSVDPLTTNLTLAFNADQWTADAQGQRIEVTVYARGQAGVSLPVGLDEIELDSLGAPGDECDSEVYVLFQNLSRTRTHSVSVEAEALSELDGPESQVLDNFVIACDPDYDYQYIRSGSVNGLDLRTHVLRLTSGVWRSTGDVDPNLWEHWLTIVEPPVIKDDTVLLMISGGSNASNPASTPGLLAPFATATGTVAALLQTVPNQPLVFAGEDAGMTEDEILAYSFDKYLHTHKAGHADTTWPVHLAMTRAAVRAMDAVQEFMENRADRPVILNDFVVTGASKRGWATWLAGATDQRVKAIMPIVIDVLNLQDSIKHHFRAYGFYSNALEDYEDEGIFDHFDTPEMASLLQIVDPFSYLDQLAMPKFILNSTGDEFFLPDSSRFYFDHLQGENYLFYAPNTDHGMSNVTENSEPIKSAVAFYTAFIQGVPRPTFQWTLEAENRLVLTADSTPTEVRLWQATNAGARDFRKEIIGSAWTSTVLHADEQGRYVGEVQYPAAGWRAFLLQIFFPGPDPRVDADFGFTTDVHVAPDTYPPAS
ncbi:MAG: PKD domain-containing protein [Candidatus Hydrogenedentes bacterium]|nr:PKD domain-containing protein [Candidatus Hydrogenedentota bacterium]